MAECKMSLEQIVLNENSLTNCACNSQVMKLFTQFKDMPIFAYTARETATGREIRNTVEAASEQAAIASLLNRNLLVMSIQEKLGKSGKTSGGKIRLADLVIFTRQLATMIDAGIAVVQSLQALGDQSPNKAMQAVIKNVTTRVESGESFSEVTAELEAKTKLVSALEAQLKQANSSEAQTLRAENATLKDRVALLEGQVAEMASKRKQPADAEGFLEKYEALEETIRKLGGEKLEGKK